MEDGTLVIESDDDYDDNDDNFEFALPVED